jgi:hypothetical protein
VTPWDGTLAVPRRPEPPLAWCPLCELPRARLHTITFLGVPATFSSCPCVTTMLTVLLDGVRSVPMTENHDPGDEDRS